MTWCLESFGVEGLGLEAGVHYLDANTLGNFRTAIESVPSDKLLHEALSRNAYSYVEQNCESLFVANYFEYLHCHT